MKKTFKIYLSARISPDAHEWNNTVCGALDKRFKVFKPHENNPTHIDHTQLQSNVFKMDLGAMQESDAGLLLTPYGRDCAWETGWYAGAKKPIVLYTEQETDWLRDWMLKGGLTAAVTPSKEVFAQLKKDPILADKCFLIASREELSSTLAHMCSQKRGGQRG